MRRRLSRPKNDNAEIDSQWGQSCLLCVQVSSARKYARLRDGTEGRRSRAAAPVAVGFARFSATITKTMTHALFFSSPKRPPPEPILVFVGNQSLGDQRREPARRSCWPGDIACS